MSEPWPPLPTTDGATVTVTLHPHFLHAYCSPCFICIVTSLNRIGEGVDTPLSVFVHRAVSPSMSRPHGLSKSRFISGLQCHKQLWWRVHEPASPELVPDAARQAVFDNGTRVGEVARGYVPGGVLIDLPHDEYDGKRETTQQA